MPFQAPTLSAVFHINICVKVVHLDLRLTIPALQGYRDMLGGKRSSITPLVLCMFLSFFICSGTSSEIPLGSRLSVMENNSWVSSNGDFAIGFFKLANQYSVGIRFYSFSIPFSKQEVVWVAGGEIQVSSNAYFELKDNGELVLVDSTTGRTAWTSQTSNLSVESAVLRDDGNLVLMNSDKDIVWQSFDTPSDTLLPGQNLSVSKTLRPPKRNSVSSYYSLYVDILGQLQLRWETSVIYWKIWEPSQSVVRGVLNSDGVFQLFDKRSKPVWSAYGQDHNDSDIKFRFLRLDTDGNLRLYSWVNDSMSWRTAWQAVDNQCEVFATCYLRGICVFNASGSHFCRCPFPSSGESNSKCLVPYQQDCTSASSMITHEHTMLYGIYPPNDTIVQTSLLQCRNLCHEDPLCTAASFTNNGSALCLIKRTQYIGGWSDASIKTISFVKTCSDPTAVLLPNSTSSLPQTTPMSERISIPCLLGVAGGTLVLFILVQFGIGILLCKRRRHLQQRAAPAYVVPYATGCVMLSYSEIRNLTENFKYQIGPKMFKGMLPSDQPVVVKNLGAAVEEKKFRRTVLKIGSICHKNLVKLDGYCCDPGHRFLVYEFAKNGSLRECLEDPRMSKRLTWRKRMDICLSVAKAIAYLHTGCREFVSHGNLKCENVVLDENLDARVSEFGLKPLSGEITETEETAELDVKDFGKTLVEVISGHPNDVNVCEWAYEKWVRGETERIRDERIDGWVDSDELERALRIAFWSLHVDERQRPSMGEVVKVLEGTLTVDPPPSPFAEYHQRLSEE